MGLVERHALKVEVVVVFVDGHVKRPLHVHLVHVNLHLRVVHRLRLIYATLHHVGETFGVMGLKLQDVRLVGCVGQALAHAVKRTAKVPCVIFYAPLLVRIRINFPDCHASAAQVIYEAHFFCLAASEQTQQSRAMPLGFDPVMAVPELAAAFLASNRRTKVKPARCVVLVSLDARVDRGKRLAGGYHFQGGVVFSSRGAGAASAAGAAGAAGGGGAEPAGAE